MSDFQSLQNYEVLQALKVIVKAKKKTNTKDAEKYTSRKLLQDIKSMMLKSSFLKVMSGSMILLIIIWK